MDENAQKRPGRPPLSEEERKRRRAESKRLWQQKNKDKQKQYTRRWRAKQVEGGPTHLESLDNHIEEPFGTIYADPPWRYENNGSNGAVINHYNTMSLDDICALPVSGLAAENAHLWLWTTVPLLSEILRSPLLDQWGFEYKSCYSWNKPRMGLGSYLRVSHELLILATRGDVRGLSKKERSWGIHPQGRHSEKPHAIRHMIERLSPSPRLELFARHAEPGWHIWGDHF